MLGSTFLTGLAMRHILGYNETNTNGQFTWNAALLFGAIVSATDPVAVVALLKELGASKKLSTLIEGESLLNDGTAMVVFLVLLELVEGVDLTWGDIILKFVRLSFGGPLLGAVFGGFVSLILQRIHNNFVLEVNITIVAAYLVFFLAENTGLHVSGILALVALGVYMAWAGKADISAESEHALHHVWGYVGFIAETVIFFLSGLVLGGRLSHPESNITAGDYGKVFANYLLLHVIRFFMLFLFWPILNRLGYGMSI